jgi:hypothetical protein
MQRIEQYHHVRVENYEGRTEHWLLTDNEVERLRERSTKAEHLLPLPLPAWRALLLRWMGWLRG